MLTNFKIWVDKIELDQNVCRGGLTRLHSLAYCHPLVIWYIQGRVGLHGQADGVKTYIEDGGAICCMIEVNSRLLYSRHHHSDITKQQQRFIDVYRPLDLACASLDILYWYEMEKTDSHASASAERTHREYPMHSAGHAYCTQLVMFKDSL